MREKAPSQQDGPTGMLLNAHLLLSFLPAGISSVLLLSADLRLRPVHGIKQGSVVGDYLTVEPSISSTESW